MSAESRGKTIATAEPVRALMLKVAEMGFPMSVFVAFGPGEAGKGTLSATHLHGMTGTDFAALIRLAISSLEHDLAAMEADESNEPPAGAGGFLN